MHCVHRQQLIVDSTITGPVNYCDHPEHQCRSVRLQSQLKAIERGMVSKHVACEGCPFFKSPLLEDGPLVSCILPTYNMPERLGMLEEAVESFFKQTYQNKELVIVVDSPGQVLEFDNPQVTIINSATRFASLGDKLNAAISASHGEYICRFDDDDISLSTRISLQVAKLQEGFEYVTTGSIWYGHGDAIEWQKQSGYGHAQGMFTKADFDKCGGYKTLSGDEDADLHSRLIKTSHTVLDEPCFLYRWSNGISGHGSGEKMQAAFNENGILGTSGTYDISPHWKRDYDSITNAIGRGKVTLPPLSETKLCVIGFPSKYGGADTELDHQITCWRAMGVEVHLIPTGEPDANQLSLNVAERGCFIHKARDWKACRGMHVISYCNGDFLENLGEIKKYARSTTFVNCMTWLFEKEKIAHSKGLIDISLYQTDHAREKVENDLKKINPKFQWARVRPYFDLSAFQPAGEKSNSEFRFCRVSRDDPAKFSKETMRIFREFESPLPKRGKILGITDKIYDKTGTAPEFVECLAPGAKPAANVYAESHCLIQSCDTYENLPRVAMEAMASGCVPIVDNRGGWREIVEHGASGFLCGSPAEFIEKSTYLASNPEERGRMAIAGRQRVEKLYGLESATKEWDGFFRMLDEKYPQKAARVPQNLIERVQFAIENAEEGISDLSERALNLEGMSSPKVRRLLNNLKSKRYLEIGSWKGSTAVSALEGNGTGVCIDNWSQFDGPRAEFVSNIQGIPAKLIDGDCLTVDRRSLSADFDLFFYDGDHSPEATRKSIALYAANLASEAVIVVDDTNFAGVADAARMACCDAGLQIVKEWSLPARHNGDVEQWWNGLLVLAVTKSVQKLTTTEKAKSFIAVTGATVLSKLRGKGGLLSTDEIQSRLDICQECPLLGSDGKCSVCGCSCNGRIEWINKLAHPTSHCQAEEPKHGFGPKW